MSLDIDDYREYISSSRGEFTVSKDLYVRTRSGWFSDRTVCYLAAGRPVITQFTGFEKYIPSGIGLLGFDDADSAVDAIRTVNSDYPRHAKRRARNRRRVFRCAQIARRDRREGGSVADAVRVAATADAAAIAAGFRLPAASLSRRDRVAVRVRSASPAAIALRRRRRIVTSPSFMMLGLGALIDLLGWRGRSQSRTLANVLAGAAVLFFFWGVVRLLMDAVDHASRRARREVLEHPARSDQSESLCRRIWLASSRADFQVNVYSLVASVGVLGVVIGFAVQQTLGDIFSGLALQLQRPFDHGDWVRSGQFLGRVQGVGVRSTTVITRAQRAPRNSQLGHRQGSADQLRHSSGVRRNFRRHQLQRAAQPGARGHSQGDARRAARADRTVARGAGLGVRRLRRSSIGSSTGFPTTLCRKRSATRW